MKIDHPLWAGSQLEQASRLHTKEQMMTLVRQWIEQRHCLPDLTNSEASYLWALREWLDAANAEYEF